MIVMLASLNGCMLQSNLYPDTGADTDTSASCDSDTDTDTDTDTDSDTDTADTDTCTFVGIMNPFNAPLQGALAVWSPGGLYHAQPGMPVEIDVSMLAECGPVAPTQVRVLAMFDSTQTFRDYAQGFVDGTNELEDLNMELDNYDTDPVFWGSLAIYWPGYHPDFPDQFLLEWIYSTDEDLGAVLPVLTMEPDEAKDFQILMPDFTLVAEPGQYVSFTVEVTYTDLTTGIESAEYETVSWWLVE